MESVAILGRCRHHVYPDSVNLVRPPNTTMPNTLAALPSSQYATDLELVSGKNFLVEPDFSIDSPLGDAIV
jgi:hypothetical protein